MNMKFILQLILILFVLVYTTNCKVLPYNAHSFDDVGMWRQLVIKDVRYIKIDIQAASSDACINYSSWQNGTNSCYLDTSKNIELCCLALRGDTSSVPNLTKPFNTSYDMLNWLNKNQDILKNLQQPLRFQLDFCSGQHRDEPVGALFEDFMNSLQQIITSSNIMIETPGYFDFPDFAINMDTPSIPQACKDYVWPHSSLPYNFYEPSSESDIENTINEVLYHCPSLPASRRTFNMNTTLMLTSNLEKEMFEVYASSLLPTGNQTLLYKNTSYASLVTLHDSYIGILHISANNSAIDILQMPHLQLISTFTINKEYSVSNMSRSVLQNGTSVLAVNYVNGDVDLFNVDERGHIKYSTSFSLNQELDMMTIIDSYMENVYYFVGLKIKNKSCGLQIYVWKENIATPLYTQCLLPNSIVIDSISMDMLRLYNDTNVYEGIIMFSTPMNSTDFQNIYGMHLLMKVMKDTSISIEVIGNKLPLTRLDFGSDPSVSLVFDPTTTKPSLLVIEAHTNGMCQNGPAINNGDDNHCQIAMGKVPGLHNVPGLLNYNYGKLADFKENIQNRQPFIGGCDAKVMHAKYDGGLKPHIDIYTDEKSRNVQAIEIHVGSNLGGLIELCGMPQSLTDDGIIFDSFSLVQPNKL